MQDCGRQSEDVLFQDGSSLKTYHGVLLLLMQGTSGMSLVISSFPGKHQFFWIFETILPALEDVKGIEYLSAVQKY